MTQVSGLYIHVPFCKHLCNYCDFYKQKFSDPSVQIDGFHQFLLSSLKNHEQLMLEHSVKFALLETVYLGGGTPSLWGTAGAKFWKGNLNFSLRSDAEFTMEVDPGTWTEEMIMSWQELGLNRLSIGTQALNSEFLKIMDRVHSIEESLALLKYCQDKKWNFSMDFLLGIPFSREKGRNVIKELELLLQYEPKHVSLYILNARSKYPFVSVLPDDDYIHDEYMAVSEFLQKYGFHHYEVSNFALPGFESKHNLKYWRSESVAAIGPTGTGLFVLEEDKALRYKWKVIRSEVELEWLTHKELVLENTYLSLRTSEGWAPLPGLENVVKGWEARGLGKFSNGKMKLNSNGFVILDSLMDDLFKAGL